jgi:dTDP-4-amino-4,6-dideoxygalactose transaminase
MKRPIPAIPMPLGWSDVLAACLMGPGAAQAFEEACRQYHGAVKAFAVSSGRAALYVGLQALRRVRPERTRVLLPAYTCPTVGRAVMAAGLSGLCVDVSLDDFNLDVEQAEAAVDDTVLAVVVPHMFGTPAAVARLRQICQASRVTLIEDAAQACGARFDGRLVGTFGELAFLSLGRSKSLRGYRGGVLLVNDPDLVEVVEEEVARLSQGGWLRASGICRQLAISALSAPRMWQMAKKLPWLRVGAEDQEFDERPGRLAAWQAGLGLLALRRLEAYSAHRERMGRAMEQELAGATKVHLQANGPPRVSVYTRLALRLDCSGDERDGLVDALQAEGIDARAFYTRAMYQYDWWEEARHQAPCPNAERLVATNIALPVYWRTGEPEARVVAQALLTALGT